MNGQNDHDLLEYMPLRDVVFMTLRRQILKGELLPGERLTEISLAKRLGVSRTPVREAIRKLEHEGLVEMLPRRGARVAGITRKELSDVLEVRKTLEVLAISRACEHITGEDIEALTEAENTFRGLVDSPEDNLAGLGKADEHFHGIIYQAAGNRRLIQILENLREQMYRFRVEYLKGKDVRRSLISEHDALIVALSERNKEEAIRLIALHIDNQRTAINEALDQKNPQEEIT